VSIFKPCPLCGSGNVSGSTTNGGDERIGYNFTHTIRCQQCGCQQSTVSKHDKNGWCNESPEKVIARATVTWNTRTAPASVDLSELREYHAKAISNLKSYADDECLRDSDVKHYTKRAEFHERMVELIDKVKEPTQ
jgi:hypothetical protein